MNLKLPTPLHFVIFREIKIWVDEKASSPVRSFGGHTI